MALTRKMLRNMGIEDDKIDEIIAAHTDTVDALKEERDGYKKAAERLPTVEKLETLKNNDTGDWQKKYEDEHAAFEAYKNDVSAKEAYAAKESAYRQKLIDAGIEPRRINTIIRAEKTTIDALKLDKTGKLTDDEKITESIKTDWADFITTTHVTGTNTANPPANTGGKATMTKNDIMKIKDPIARQNAIAENIQLYRKE